MALNQEEMSADCTFRSLCGHLVRQAEKAVRTPEFQAGYKAWRKMIDTDYGGDWRAWYRDKQSKGC